jgi:hypothetical protein
VTFFCNASSSFVTHTNVQNKCFYSDIFILVETYLITLVMCLWPQIIVALVLITALINYLQHYDVQFYGRSPDSIMYIINIFTFLHYHVPSEDTKGVFHMNEALLCHVVIRPSHFSKSYAVSHSRISFFSPLNFNTYLPYALFLCSSINMLKWYFQCLCS